MSTSYTLYCPQCGNSFKKYHHCPKCKIPLGPKSDILKNTPPQKQILVTELQRPLLVPDLHEDVMVIYKGEEPFHNFYLSHQEEIFIGRSPKCDIWFAVETVSKEHARIYKEGDQYYLEDLGSKNGTSLNQERLSQGVSLPIKDKDLIQISSFLLYCHFPSHAQSQNPSNPIDSNEKTPAPSTTNSTRVRQKSNEEAKTIYAIRSDKKIKEKFDEAERIVGHYLKPIPSHSGNARFASLYKPLTQIGGDFYLANPLGNHKFAIAIGDVSGHGMPAALIMIACLTMLEIHGRHTFSPAEILTHVNQEIHSRLEKGKFVTLFYAVLDTETGKLVYSSAGHHPPILFHPERGATVLEGKGPAFGLAPYDMIEYREHVLTLTPQDRLLLFTDGLLETGSEAASSSQDSFMEDLKKLILSYNGTNFNELFGQIRRRMIEWEEKGDFGLDRLVSFVQENQKRELQDFLNTLYERLLDFVAPSMLEDDITMIGIDWKPER